MLHEQKEIEDTAFVSPQSDTQFIAPPSSPRYGPETTRFLGLLAKATQETFEGLALPVEFEKLITNKEGEKQVRNAFASEELQRQMAVVDAVAIDHIIAGGSAQDVELILAGKPFSQKIEEVGDSVLEIGAAKWLVDQGLASPERAANIVKQEFGANGDRIFSTAAMAEVSKTDRQEEFVATMLGINVLRNMIAEEIHDDNVLENTIDILAFTFIPFFTSISNALTVGRKLGGDVEQLGDSILNFSRAFWALPFKERMAKLTEFKKDIINGTMFGGNPFSAAVQLEQLLSFTDEDKLGVNAIEAGDVLIVGGTAFRLFKAFKTISGAGRGAGAGHMTGGRAVVLREKEASGRALTIIEEDELIENILPSSAIEVAGGEKAVGLTTQAFEILDITEAYEKLVPGLLKQLEAAGVDVTDIGTGPVDLIRLLKRTLTPEILKETEQGQANIAAIKAILRDAGVDMRMTAIVDPEKLTGGAISNRVYPVYDVSIDEITGIRTVHVFLGTGENLTKGFTSEEAALAGAERMRILKDFFEVSEKSGEWFIKVSRNPGTTQYISVIDPSEIPRTVPVLSRALAGRAANQTLDDIKGARLSDSAETILMDAVVKAVAAINPRTSIRGPGLSPKQKTIYDELMLEIQHTEKWKTGAQIAEWYQKHHQRLPTKRETEAYLATRQIYAFDYLIRNNRVKNDLIGAGYQEVQIRGLQNSPVVGKEVTGTSLPPSQVKIYDALTKSMVKVKDEAELNKLLARGNDLVLIKNLTRDKNFGDYVIAKRDDVNIRPLRAQVLNKVDGPHRMYKGTVFIKQQRIRNIGGVETIVHPKTHFVIEGVSEAKKYAKAYNEALNAYNVALRSGNVLDKMIASDFISKNTIFSGFEEMEKAIGDGRMENTPFEVVKSGGFPLFKMEQVGARSIDPDLANLPDEVQELITNGWMFYSSRGPMLPHPDGSIPPLLHPDQILALAVRNAVTTQAFGNYRARQPARWVATYGKHLIKQPGWGVDKMFMLGKFPPVGREGPGVVPISATTLRNAEIQRSGIKRFLRSPGIVAQSVERYRDMIIDIIDDRFNSNVADRAADIMSNNPIVFLRGAAFKAFLGSDMSQAIIQTSMTPGVIAVAPVEAGKSIALYSAMRGLLLNPQHIPFVANLVEKAGIMPAKVFTQMMDDLDRSGAGIIGKNQAEIDGMTNEGGILSLGGALLRRGSDATMVIFNEAERFVRVLGYTIAWQEFFKKTGKFPKTVDEFAGIMVRGMALSGNMTRAEKAWWQEGILGLATQFVAQPFRMGELLLLETPGGFEGQGILNPKNFGKAKGRMYIGLALASGVTLGVTGDQGPTGSVVEYVKQRWFEEHGEEIPEEMLRGLLSGVIGLMFPDTDISRIQVFGQGTPLSDFFTPNQGIDIANMLGASGSMLNTFYDATLGSAKLWAFLNGNLNADLIPLTLMDIANDVGKTLVGYNRLQKAIHAYQTGEYISNRGDFLQRDVDTFDAIMIGLGLPPLMSSEAYTASAYMTEYVDKVRLDAKQAVIYYRRANAAEPGSREERYNLSLVAYLRDLNGGKGDLNGDGGALFATTFDKIMADSRSYTEKVRIRANNMFRRDPTQLNRDK